MVEYEYENLFYDHSRVDLLIVQHDATCTWNSSTHKFDVTNSDYVIDNTLVDSESIQLDEKICSQNNLKFGLCESACLQFSIYNRTSIPNLEEELIDFYIYFNGDGTTLFQVGVYRVNEDNYSAGRLQRDVIAYDLLYYARDVDITDWYTNYFESGQRYKIIDALTDAQDGLLKYMQDEEDIPLELASNQSLINGDFTIGRTIESDTITFGFFVQGLLEFNGVFGHINRQGKLEFKKLEWYSVDPVRIVTDHHRFPPTMYQDIPTWGIGGLDVYDRTNVRKFKIRNTSKKRPSIYVLVDPFVIADKETGDTATKEALNAVQSQILWHLNYTPCEVECIGDLCVEVGDRINVTFAPTEGDTRSWFRSYVLERHFTGLQGMVDIYSANGDLKQPKHKIRNDKWHVGDSGDTATSGSGTGGVSEVDNEHDRRLIQLLRNRGDRFLEEPSAEVVYDKANQAVKIKWTDPSDITNYKPHPCEWEGTVVIRKEGEAPLHRWDGTLIVSSTTRDEYASDYCVDDTIEMRKKYYYSIMPYFTVLDDADHPIKRYTWTKVFSVDTEEFITAPTILYAECDEGTEVVITYLLPELTDSTYSYVKLAYKKDGIPKSLTDADGVIDITNNPVEPMLHSGQYTVTGLDELTQYYFVIFVENSNGTKAGSDAASCITKEDLGTDFSYTGAIQTFTAPKTGIYSLETWGAQGGDATDGTNTARGGYGAYAYGEVLLQQGDVLYVNVGGQNGYGGGGNANYSVNAFSVFKGTDLSSAINCGEAIGTKFYQSNFNVANSSGQLLSNKMFYALGAQGVNPTIDSQNKTITYPVALSGWYVYSVHLIPVDRITGAKYIKCTAVRTENASSSYPNGYFELSVYSVDNSQMTIGANIDISNPTVNEEVEVTLDVSQVSYIDYIGFGVTKDPWIIKDIQIVYES